MQLPGEGDTLAGPCYACAVATHPLLAELIRHMVRESLLTPSELLAMADRLEAYGEEESAHAARAILVEATGTDPGDYQRSLLRLVPVPRMEPDGGNSG